ncbi:unnamed protein product, partial [Didymodactylos carnosus]
ELVAFVPYYHDAPGNKSNDQEALIVKMLATFDDWGFPRTRRETIDLTTKFIREAGLCSKFRIGYPGIEWLRLFLKRWSNELKQRSSALLEISRAVALTEDRVNVWFKNYGDVLEKLDIRDRPSQVFNMDETGFLDNRGKKRVIVRNSKRHPAYRIHGGTAKQNTTVLFCISAGGQVLPPLIIFKAKTLRSNWCTGSVKGTCYGANKSGWINEDTFIQWMKKCFIPNTSALPRLLLLLLDGHSSHLSYQACVMALQHQIHILCIPSHSTHALQPLDSSFLGTIKRSWKNLLTKYYDKYGGKSLDKELFTYLLKKLFDETISPSLATVSFTKTGLYPLDPTAIPKSKIRANNKYYGLSENGTDQSLQLNESSNNSSHPVLPESLHQSTPQLIPVVALDSKQLPSTDDAIYRAVDDALAAADKILNSTAPLLTAATANSTDQMDVSHREAQSSNSKSSPALTESVFNDSEHDDEEFFDNRAKERHTLTSSSTDTTLLSKVDIRSQKPDDEIIQNTISQYMYRSPPCARKRTQRVVPRHDGEVLTSPETMKRLLNK